MEWKIIKGMQICTKWMLGFCLFIVGLGIKDLKKKKKAKEEEKTKAAEATKEQKKKERKVFDLPGQKREPPEEVHYLFSLFSVRGR